MVQCLTQEHNMLVKAGFEPTTFGLRVNSFIHCATHAHDTCPPPVSDSRPWNIVYRPI